MKKLLFFLLLAVLMCACGGKKEVKQTTDESVWDTPMEVVQEPEPVDTVALREKAIKFLKDGGAIDAYVDEDGYLVYVENPAKISANPNEVAKMYYEMFSDTPIAGFKIVSSITKEVIGSY